MRASLEPLHLVGYKVVQPFLPLFNHLPHPLTQVTSLTLDRWNNLCPHRKALGDRWKLQLGAWKCLVPAVGQVSEEPNYSKKCLSGRGLVDKQREEGLREGKREHLLRCRTPVITQMIRMPVLHGDFDPLVEPHGIGKVPAIGYLVRRHFSFVNDSTCKWEGIVLHGPCLAEIVLATGTVHRRRPGVIIDKDHIIAFTPPRPLKMIHGVVTADVSSRTGRLEKDIVPFAVEIGHVSFQGVRLQIRRSPSRCRVLTSPMGVEEERIVAVRPRLQLVVDVEVLEVGHVVLILDFDASTLVERPNFHIDIRN